MEEEEEGVHSIKFYINSHQIPVLNLQLYEDIVCQVCLSIYDLMQEPGVQQRLNAPYCYTQRGSSAPRRVTYGR